MTTNDLLPAGSGLAVIDTAVTPDGITVALTATAAAADCPTCGNPSDRAHSRYRRTLADLPAGGRRLVLRVAARRFLCRKRPVTLAITHNLASSCATDRGSVL